VNRATTRFCVRRSSGLLSTGDFGGHEPRPPESSSCINPCLSAGLVAPGFEYRQLGVYVGEDGAMALFVAIDRGSYTNIQGGAGANR